MNDLEEPSREGEDLPPDPFLDDEPKKLPTKPYQDVKSTDVTPDISTWKGKPEKEIKDFVPPTRRIEKTKAADSISELDAKLHIFIHAPKQWVKNIKKRMIDEEITSLPKLVETLLNRWVQDG